MPEAIRPKGLVVCLDALDSQLFDKLSRDSEILTARIRLIQYVKVLPGQAHAPKAVGAARAGDAFDQVGARSTTFTFDTMLTANQRFTVATMRAIRAAQAAYTIVASNQAL